MIVLLKSYNDCTMYSITKYVISKCDVTENYLKLLTQQVLYNILHLIKIFIYVNTLKIHEIYKEKEKYILIHQSTSTYTEK